MIPLAAPPQPPLQRATNAPPSLLANNPTTPCILQTKPRMHLQNTRNNTPSALPHINCTHCIPMLPLFTEIPTPHPFASVLTAMPCQSNQLNSALLPCFRNVRFISQETINSLIVNGITKPQHGFTPLQLHPKYTTQQNLEYYGLAMVHPITGEHITNYRKLMQDSETLVVWMRVFGKDF